MTMPKEHAEVDVGDGDMERDKELVHPGSKNRERMDAKDDERDQCGNTRAVDVELTIEIGLECCQSSFIPHWGDIERNGMDQAQEEAQIATPSVQNIQSFMANACDHGDKVGLHAESNNPGHHSHC